MLHGRTENPRVGSSILPLATAFPHLVVIKKGERLSSSASRGLPMVGSSWPRVWPNRYRGGWEAIRFRRQCGRPRPGARADDDERLAVEEPHGFRLERGVADLIAVVDAHDPRVTSDPKLNQRLGVRHRHTRAVPHRHRD